MGCAAGPGTGRRIVRLLDYDPALGATLRPERRAEARESAHARPVVEVPRGDVHRRGADRRNPAAYGVLLLDGLVNRTVVLDGGVSAQLLGPGDLLRIGDDAATACSPPPTSAGRCSSRSTVALLDERFLLTVRRWPELVAALFARVAAQEERREVHRALSQLPRVEDRVHALLWLLAERWGRMTPRAVVLRLRLTHELIGQLVGAKRPTVSLALKQLEARGSVHRRADGGWLLEHAWSAPPTAAVEPPVDGVALPRDATRTPPSTGSSEEIVEDVRRRIERMRHVRARTRQDAAATLRRTVAARDGSGSLRDRRTV